MSLEFSGIFCGLGGGKQGTFSASLTKSDHPTGLLSYSGEWNETDGDEGTFIMKFIQTDISFIGTYHVVKNTYEGGSYSYTISGKRNGNSYEGIDSRGRTFSFEVNNNTLSGSYHDPDGGETGQLNGIASNGILSPFDKNSYLPIIENTTWTYNNGATVKVTEVDTENNTFRIINTGDSGAMEGIAGADLTGNYIGYSGFSGPEFMPIAGYFGFTPLLYENSKISVGLTWQDSGTSNSYPYTNTCTIVSIDTDITTPGGQIYNDCIVLKREITYPNGYDWNG